MKKSRIAALAAVALGTLVAGSVMVSACGEKVDYSNYTYSQWKAITYSEWDKKDITWQFHTNTAAGERMDVGFGAQGCYTMVLLNLYEDGTAAYFQAGLYDTGASNQVWYDQLNHISWAHFGFWEQTDDAIKVYMVGYFAAEDQIVTTEDSLAQNKGCTVVTIPAADGTYKYSSDNIEVSEETEGSNIFMRYGINDNGEGMGIDQEMVGKTGADIEYKTIEDWIAIYDGEQMGLV